MKKYLYVFLLLVGQLAQSQIFFNDESNDEEYEISESLEIGILNKYLESIGAVKIEFNQGEWMYDVPFKVANAEGKWWLVADDGMVLDFEMKAVDSVGFPFYSGETDDFIAVVKNNNAYGFLDLNAKKGPKYLYQKIVLRELESGYGDTYLAFLAKKDGKWGRVSFSNEVVENFTHASSKDVPIHMWDDWEIGELLNTKKEKKLDLIRPIPEDPYFFNARHRKSKKWGLYGGDEGFYEIVPAEYDSVVYDTNSNIAAIWEDGKVGYYTDGELVMEPAYDDLEVIDIDYDFAVALKKDGMWQFYGSYEATVLFDQTADDPYVLLELWLNR